MHSNSNRCDTANNCRDRSDETNCACYNDNNCNVGKKCWEGKCEEECKDTVENCSEVFTKDKCQTTSIRNSCKQFCGRCSATCASLQAGHSCNGVAREYDSDLASTEVELLTELHTSFFDAKCCKDKRQWGKWFLRYSRFSDTGNYRSSEEKCATISVSLCYLAFRSPVGVCHLIPDLWMARKAVWKKSSPFLCVIFLRKKV